MERSEFSLQHQSSELDEEESFTFENLNNQSLSVIDEDGDGGLGVGACPPESEELRGFVQGARGSLRQQQTITDDLSAVYLERFDSKELESERDLSLEAVLQEESKALEEQVWAAQQAKTVTVNKNNNKQIDEPEDDDLPPYRETAIEFSDQENSIDQEEVNGRRVSKTTDKTVSHSELHEEAASRAALYSVDDKTTLHESSQDILGSSHFDDESTELRDERIALLGDSSDYTHSGLPKTTTSGGNEDNINRR